jgi:hypothetical protein
MHSRFARSHRPSVRRLRVVVVVVAVVAARSLFRSPQRWRCWRLVRLRRESLLAGVGSRDRDYAGAGAETHARDGAETALLSSGLKAVNQGFACDRGTPH